MFLSTVEMIPCLAFFYSMPYGSPYILIVVLVVDDDVDACGYQL